MAIQFDGGHTSVLTDAAGEWVNFTAFVYTTVVDQAEFKNALADAAIEIILLDGILTIGESGTIEGKGKTVVGDIVIASRNGITIRDLEIRGTVTIGAPVGSSSVEAMTGGGQEHTFHLIGVTIAGDLIVNYHPFAGIGFYDSTVQGSADVWAGDYFVSFDGFPATFHNAIKVHSGTLYLHGRIDVPLPTLQMLWPDGDPLEPYIAYDFAAKLLVR